MHEPETCRLRLDSGSRPSRDRRGGLAVGRGPRARAHATHTRALPETDARLYASPACLDRIGRPGSATGLGNAVFIGRSDPDRLLQALSSLGIPATRRRFRYLSANALVAWEMVRPRLGPGIMPVEIAGLTDGVEPVLPALPPVRFPTWLTTHRKLHTSRRIRLVFDLLAGELAVPGGVRRNASHPVS